MVRGIIHSLQESKTKQGNSYVVVTLYNKDGKFTVSVWGSKKEDFIKGTIFSASVKTSEDGFMSCTLKDIIFSEPTAEDFTYLPHQTSKQEWDRVIQTLTCFCPQHTKLLKEMGEFLFEKYYHGYCATQHHHTGEGGLLTHTYELLNMFTGLYSTFPVKVDPFIVTVACAWHDYGKLLDYLPDGTGYNEDYFLVQHPVNSAIACKEWLQKHDIDERTIKFIFHAILSHHMRQEWGAPVVPANPEAFLVAMLDQLSGFGTQFNVKTGTKAMGTTIQRY